VNVPADVLEQALDLLLEEERQLSTLLDLALQEQSALIASDFQRIAMVSESMQAASARIEAVEESRLNLLRTFGAETLTLQELAPLADDLGVDGFAAARGQLLARAKELRDAQELNARLLLNAMKVRDRWANLLGGFAAPGYSSDGRRQSSATRGAISRSA